MGEKVAMFSAPDSVTAVAVCPVVRDGFVLAVGLDNGMIGLIEWNLDKFEQLVDWKSCHHKTVNRVKWKKFQDQILLASCSNDHSVKIYDIKL